LWLEACGLQLFYFFGQADSDVRIIGASLITEPQLDPRSLGADQLITSVPTKDLGSSLAKRLDINL